MYICLPYSFSVQTPVVLKMKGGYFPLIKFTRCGKHQVKK